MKLKLLRVNHLQHLLPDLLLKCYKIVADADESRTPGAVELLGKTCSGLKVQTKNRKLVLRKSVVLINSHILQNHRF